MDEENKRKKTLMLTIIAVSSLLLVVIGATYAYFQVLATNNVTGTNTQGQTDIMPKATLVTNRDAVLLKLNLDANLMKEENAGITYYATPSGTPVTTPAEENGRYTLATASLDKDGLIYDCTYSYRISAEDPAKEINDGSDADIKVKITGSDGYEEIYTLAKILNDGSQVYSGNIKDLKYGANQKIYIEAYVTNTNKKQDDLAGNSFTFTIDLVKNSFSCDAKKPPETLATKLIKSGDLWQSGLEGDGYRYYGTGVTCSYDNGNYIGAANNQYTTPSCPTLYNYTSTSISSGSTYDYTYKTSCPSDDEYDTYSCTELTGTIIESSKNKTPDNFICFGTTDATECKNNEAKYMYRILGVFSDTNGNQHLKLISFKQIGYYNWDADYETDVSWENSDIYIGLNGTYFLTNTSYDYMQNSTWLNKIENWQWTATNTKTHEYDGSKGPDYTNLTSREIYLHEMNRSSKSSDIGEWTTPTAKIGLMYVSDYALSLGNDSLDYTSSSNASSLLSSWIHYINNGISSYRDEWGEVDGELVMTRYSFSDESINNNYVITSRIPISVYDNGIRIVARPVFYLTSDVMFNSGDGTYENPYIIKE